MRERTATQPSSDAARPRDTETLRELFARPAFYAEFAPAPRHEGVIDHLYILRDRGLLTADRRAFASPFPEIAFAFRREGDAHKPKVTLLQPRSGRARRGGPFHGWLFGVKIAPGSNLLSCPEGRPVAECSERLARSIEGDGDDLLPSLDRLVDDLVDLAAPAPADFRRPGARARVARLASDLGQSPRTLHRRVSASTGLAPKRLLATDRFHRAVYAVATQDGGLSGVASELGFADQAHLTREFRKHAGLSPGVFKTAWRGVRGHSVRFVQDAGAGGRLRLVVWPKTAASDRLKESSP